MPPLQLCLLFSSALFCIGLVGALARSNAILALLGIELMLNAANLKLMGRHLPAVLIAGVILTVALLGGLVLAASEVGRASARPSGSSPVVASSDPKAG